MPMPRLLACVICAVALAAADQPLGLVERVDGSQVVLSFDANARLVPGVVVAIYGPGRVEKHPLTKEIIVEKRALIAKVQVIGGGANGRFSARVAWKQGEVVSGMDAVPMPSEARPNSPPVLTTAINEQRCPVQSALTIRLAIADPDQDAVAYSWWLEGPAGQVGRLSARVTATPVITWYSPGVAGTATLKVSARDPLGEELITAVRLSAVAGDGDLRNRPFESMQRCGGPEVRLGRIERDAGGAWWGVEDGKLRVATSWLKDAPFPFAGEHAPKTVGAIATGNDQICVIDEGGSFSSGSVSVWGRDGQFRRTIAGLAKPSDLAIDADGALYVADQSSGGVMVFEPSGQHRLRLGRQGKGADSFTALSRIALGPKGELYALDREQRQVQRFDRFHRRLDTWEIPGDVRVAVIDLAVHARGLLVLLASGQIVVFNAKGIAGEAIPAAADAKLHELGEPDSLAVDANGDIYVAYPRQACLARHDASGALTGLRGAALWLPGRRFAADGSGRLYMLDLDTGLVGVFDAEGWLLGRFGGSGRKAVFGEPVRLAASPSGAAIAVLDVERKQVARFASATLLAPGEKPLLFGQPGKNNGQLSNPVDIACDEAGRSYVLDADLGRVAVFDAEGRFQFNAGRKGKGADGVIVPRLIAVSPAGDALYIYDYDTYEVKKFTLDHAGSRAVHVATAGGKGDGPGQFRRITGLGCDRLGLLYCLDDRREDVQILDFRGNNAVAVAAKKSLELGVRASELFAVGPDGLFFVGGAGDVVGVRW